MGGYNHTQSVVGGTLLVVESVWFPDAGKGFPCLHHDCGIMLALVRVWDDGLLPFVFAQNSTKKNEDQVDEMNKYSAGVYPLFRASFASRFLSRNISIILFKKKPIVFTVSYQCVSISCRLSVNV